MAAMDDELIVPYGGRLLPLQISEEEAKELRQRTDLKKIRINHREIGDLMMLGIGGFSPLGGYMNQQDWRSVCCDMHLANGLFWPIPITVSTDKEQGRRLKEGENILLCDQTGSPLGLLELEEKYEPDKELEMREIFQTMDGKHPGVIGVMRQGEIYLGGGVKVFTRGHLARQFPNIYMSPQETRECFHELGWRTVTAFQTRNPLHRAHEYLTKMALEFCDGVMIHSLLGRLKPGDIPAAVRIEAIETLLKHYYMAGTVLNAGYPLDMRYAGPREALLHALFRQNYGCSHFIVGRDHAGVGDYYQPYQAQEIFDEIPKGVLKIRPLKVTAIFWCNKCAGMASERSCPHNEKHRLLLSGTKLRELLSNGEEVPENYSRPEVVDVLRSYYEDRFENL